MNFFGHLRTVCRHRRTVFKHCVKAGIGFQGMFRDLSKFSPFEFFAGVKYYLVTKSPNEGQREKFGYSSAWLHHKGRNKHHFEYWVDLNPKTKMYEPVPMPTRYLKEMFCDRVAASKIYQKEHYNDTHPYEYFVRGKQNRFIHQETSDLLESWLVMLSDKGEKYTLAHIRKAVKEDRGR